MCLPYIRASEKIDVERAITDLCSLTWFLAYVVDSELVSRGSARLHRVPHKMRIKEDDGDLWFNKSCTSARMATVIKEGRKNMLYMYIGGGAVDNNQSFLIGGLVVVCKNWRWAALTHAASRLAGQACQNSLGAMISDLVLPENSRSGDTATQEDAMCMQFNEYCDAVWRQLCERCDKAFYDLPDASGIHGDVRAKQAAHTLEQLDRLLTKYRPAAEELLNEGG